MTDPSNRSESRSAGVLAKLEVDGYLNAPYDSREEYVELLMAMTQFPGFRGLLQRRNKECTALKILQRAMDPTSAEYLMNGGRYLMWKLNTYAPSYTQSYFSAVNFPYLRLSAVLI